MLPLLSFTLALLFAPDFDADFTGQTWRIDYFSTGNSREERISLDRVRREGPWAGSRTALVDDTNLGEYRVEVADASADGAGRVMWSRGFSTVFQEWSTTGEAAGDLVRTFPAALRVPEPKRAVEVRVSKRDATLAFREIWKTKLDPADRAIEKAAPLPQAVWTVQESGPPETKVDLLFLGDGYTAAQTEKFHADVKRLSDALLSEEPYKSRRSDFNVRAIDVAAAEEGVTRPRSGVYRNSPFGAAYNTFDSERYALIFDDRRWRDVAAAAPYEFVIVLLNEKQYGGGGIFNLYCTAAADSNVASYLVIHEFGHHFAALADEYYTSQVAYDTTAPITVEPWEPNVTALLDPAHLKWRDLVKDGTAIPTPWRKDEYDSRSTASQKARAELTAKNASPAEFDKLFAQERVDAVKMLGFDRAAPVVGAFEGARYQSKGLYRPCSDCLMFTRDDVGFCPVCRRALERMIDLHSAPRDGR